MNEIAPPDAQPSPRNPGFRRPGGGTRFFLSSTFETQVFKPGEILDFVEKWGAGDSRCKWACRYTVLLVLSVLPFAACGAVIGSIPTGLLANWEGEVLCQVADGRIRQLHVMWWREDDYAGVSLAAKWGFSSWQRVTGILGNTAFIVSVVIAWRGTAVFRSWRAQLAFFIKLALQLLFMWLSTSYAEQLSAVPFFRLVTPQNLNRLVVNALLLNFLCPSGSRVMERVVAALGIPLLIAVGIAVLTALFQLYFRTSSVTFRMGLLLLNQFVVRTAWMEAMYAVARFFPQSSEELLLIASATPSTIVLATSYLMQAAGTRELWQTVLANLFIILSGTIRNSLLLSGQSELRICARCFRRLKRRLQERLQGTTSIMPGPDSIPMPSTLAPAELTRRTTFAWIAAASNELEILIILMVTVLLLVSKTNIAAAGEAPVGVRDVLVHLAISLSGKLISDYLTVFFAGRWLPDVAVNEGYRLTTGYDWHLRLLVGSVTVGVTAAFHSALTGLMCARCDSENHPASVGLCL